MPRFQCLNHLQHPRLIQSIALLHRIRVLDAAMLQYMLQRSGSAQQVSHIMKVPSGAWQGAWRRLYTTTQRSIDRSSPINSGALRRSARPLHPLQPTGLRAAAPGWTPASRRGFRFSAWRRSTTDREKAKPLSLSQRLKKLFKDYGKSAIGVYLALSVLDFPFCFLLVRIVGTDTIGMLNQRKVQTKKSGSANSEQIY